MYVTVMPAHVLQVQIIEHIYVTCVYYKTTFSLIFSRQLTKLPINITCTYTTRDGQSELAVALPLEHVQNQRK